MVEDSDILEGQLARLKSLYGVSSDTDLAKKLGMTQSAISGAKARGKVPSSWIVEAVTAFGVSLPWLSTGEGPKHAEGDLIPIPMVDAILSAGLGSFEVSDDSERKYAFRSDFLQRKGSPANMVLMRVDGDSMEPEIKSGDVVLIDQSQKTLRPGQIYAVGVEDMVFLKIVSAMPGKVMLRSLKEGYPPLEVDTRGDLEDSVRIVGRCVWSCREL